MQDILFLAICFGFPVLMVAALGWLGLRAILARLAFRRALASGWQPVKEEELRGLLRDLPALADGRNVQVDRLARKAVHGVEVTTCRYVWQSRGVPEHRQGRREAWLVLPAMSQLTRATVAPRSGGLLDAVVDKVAAAAGSAPVELGEAWSWARVHGPADPEWFTPERGRALQEALQAGESLILHDRVAVLVRDIGQHAKMLRNADAITDRLRTALH